MDNVPHRLHAGAAPATPLSVWTLLVLLLVIVGVASFLAISADGRPRAGAVVALELLFSFVGFIWYCRDSDAVGYQRSLGLNVAILLLGPFSIAYYLVRSRPKGARLGAVLRLLGFVCLLIGAFVLGAVAAAIVT